MNKRRRALHYTSYIATKEIKQSGPRRGCRKICYISKSDARAAMKQLAGMGLAKRAGTAMNAYRCESCEAWHIGHTALYLLN